MMRGEEGEMCIASSSSSTWMFVGLKGSSMSRVPAALIEHTTHQTVWLLYIAYLPFLNNVPDCLVPPPGKCLKHADFIAAFFI